MKTTDRPKHKKPAKRDAARRSTMLRPDMPDVRAAVLAEMKKQDLTRYALAQKLKGKRADGSDVPAPTLYQWLRGDSDLNTGDFGLVMDALGMKLTK